MKKNSTIQLYRIIACIGVFVCHLGQRINLMGGFRLTTDLGQHGVEMFFVVSGYVACLSWYNSEKHSYKEYIIKRCIRILPMYYLSIVCLGIAEKYIFGGIEADIYGIGKYRYLFLLNGIVHEGDNYFWSNLGITWTIPVFMMFYLLFPFIINLVNNFNLSILFILACWNLTVMMKVYYTEAYMSGFTYIIYFALGIGCYYGVKEKKKKWAVLLATLAMGFNIYHGTISSTRENYALVAAIVLIIVVEKTIENQTIQKIINRIDEYTYTFYLAHGIVFCGIIDKFVFLNWQKVLIAVFGSILLTYICYHFYEKPIQRVLRKLLIKNKN